MDDKQSADFGTWLREHREARKLSQTEAGRKAKMSRTQWTRLERGESGTKRSQIPAIANAVDADLYETYRLAGYEPPKNPASGFSRSRLESIYRRMSQLRPEQRKRLDVLVDALEHEINQLAQGNQHKVA